MKNKFLLLLSPIAAMMFLYIFFAIGNWEFNLGKWSDECRSFFGRSYNPLATPPTTKVKL